MSEALPSLPRKPRVPSEKRSHASATAGDTARQSVGIGVRARRPSYPGMSLRCLRWLSWHLRCVAT